MAPRLTDNYNDTAPVSHCKVPLICSGSSLGLKLLGPVLTPAKEIHSGPSWFSINLTTKCTSLKNKPFLILYIQTDTDYQQTAVTCKPMSHVTTDGTSQRQQRSKTDSKFK